MIAKETLYLNSKKEVVTSLGNGEGTILTTEGNLVPDNIVHRFKLNERWAKTATPAPASPPTPPPAATTIPRDETPRETRALGSENVSKRTK